MAPVDHTLKQQQQHLTLKDHSFNHVTYTKWLHMHSVRQERGIRVGISPDNNLSREFHTEEGYPVIIIHGAPPRN